ncbi:Very-long-chain specific acyl-CoA dehydrogenase, putative [Pediculus humanus corporis]|uniref:Very long-chain specific acyl-CoA dehydrogenase, mitochondrial n=1 Tax=Pediculus humanus subsp. corporis TaxID=121224 RepID=E0W4E9_PEDHC|nr:Very-long-chain specific acyl-CoA dehydrogenase, putative [Pediculus humanus corporis]EEB20505.1 Very-long-chain specific acyl-CoA dehydrogenase, putative [Pediculus humanus corporis]
MSSEVAKKEPKKFEPSPSFAKNLYVGKLEPAQVFPYPNPLSNEQKETVSMLTDPFEKFFQEVNHPEINDANEEIEAPTLNGLWDMGAFGIQVPEDLGGLGLSNTQYARLVEIVGKYDLAVGICLGAHQSIGFKGILLFGTPEQKKKYLPRVSTGKEYAAFCLTEPTAGSDAASIKSRAVLSPDGSHWILNGSKIWISNGGFAEIMTVFAQTTVKNEETGVEKDAVTAFIVERSFGGVTSGPPEKKMGIKASNTTEVFYDNVKIPKENVLGGVGNGFKVAMQILNNGRFGMASALAGTMRSATAKAVEFATQRLQFGQKIEKYATIQEKLAKMAMLQYVTESLAYMISGNMDQGSTDYQVEAAISKCFASESAWTVTDEAIQIMGGMGFMRHSGLEKVLRDLRIFRIFEGTNDILRLFVALNGIQYLEKSLRQLQKEVKGVNLGVIFNEAQKRASRQLNMGLGISTGNAVHSNFQNEVALLTKCIEKFGKCAETLILKYKRDILHEQCYLHRLAQATFDIYTMAVVLSRCTSTLQKGLPSAPYEELLTKLWCHEASERAVLNLNMTEDKNYEKSFKNYSKVAGMICENGGLVQMNPLNI